MEKSIENQEQSSTKNSSLATYLINGISNSCEPEFNTTDTLNQTQKPKKQKQQVRPFLKWAGGKRNLLSQMNPYMPKSFLHYHEPFLGGGAVFFSLDKTNYKSYLSDKNPELILTYAIIKKSPEDLITILEKHHLAHNSDYYKAIRDCCNYDDPIEVAARFIYLNKTCFNGLYRVNKSGIFNVPMGKYNNPQICDNKNLIAVSEFLKNTSIFISDFRMINPGENDFVYCDPPYHDTFNDYTAQGFTDEDQKSLKFCIDKWVKKGAKVMISQSNTPSMRNLYRQYTILDISGPRLINCQPEGRKPISELLIITYAI